MLSHSSQLNYNRDAYKWCAVIWNGHTEQMMVDAHIAKWRYRGNQSIEFMKQKKVHKKRVYVYNMTQTLHMKMAITVYEYGKGGKCVYMFRGIRIISMQIENEDRHMSRVMHITRAPYQRYVFNSQEKMKENKKVMNTKPNSNHAALATQLERQVEKKTYTYFTDS